MVLMSPHAHTSCAWIWKRFLSTCKKNRIETLLRRNAFSSSSCCQGDSFRSCFELPMGGLLGGVRASQRCTVGSVFVCIRAALPAAGFEKNTNAQFLSTSQSPPPIAHPSSFCHSLALAFCSLTCFLKALWRMRMGVSQWHRLINAFYLPMAWTR